MEYNPKNPQIGGGTNPAGGGGRAGTQTPAPLPAKISAIVGGGGSANIFGNPLSQHKLADGAQARAAAKEQTALDKARAKIEAQRDKVRRTITRQDVISQVGMLKRAALANLSNDADTGIIKRFKDDVGKLAADVAQGLDEQNNATILRTINEAAHELDLKATDVYNKKTTERVKRQSQQKIADLFADIPELARNHLSAADTPDKDDAPQFADILAANATELGEYLNETYMSNGYTPEQIAKEQSDYVVAAWSEYIGGMALEQYRAAAITPEITDGIVAETSVEQLLATVALTNAEDMGLTENEKEAVISEVERRRAHYKTAAAGDIADHKAANKLLLADAKSQMSAKIGQFNSGQDVDFNVNTTDMGLGNDPNDLISFNQEIRIYKILNREMKRRREATGGVLDNHTILKIIRRESGRSLPPAIKNEVIEILDKTIRAQAEYADTNPVEFLANISEYTNTKKEAQAGNSPLVELSGNAQEIAANGIVPDMTFDATGPKEISQMNMADVRTIADNLSRWLDIRDRYDDLTNGGAPLGLMDEQSAANLAAIMTEAPAATLPPLLNVLAPHADEIAGDNQNLAALLAAVHIQSSGYGGARVASGALVELYRSTEKGLPGVVGKDKIQEVIFAGGVMAGLDSATPEINNAMWFTIAAHPAVRNMVTDGVDEGKQAGIIRQAAADIGWLTVRPSLVSMNGALVIPPQFKKLMGNVRDAKEHFAAKLKEIDDVDILLTDGGGMTEAQANLARTFVKRAITEGTFSYDKHDPHNYKEQPYRLKLVDSGMTDGGAGYAEYEFIFTHPDTGEMHAAPLTNLIPDVQGIAVRIYTTGGDKSPKPDYYYPDVSAIRYPIYYE